MPALAFKNAFFNLVSETSVMCFHLRGLRNQLKVLDDLVRVPTLAGAHDSGPIWVDYTTIYNKRGAAKAAPLSCTLPIYSKNGAAIAAPLRTMGPYSRTPLTTAAALSFNQLNTSEM